MFNTTTLSPISNVVELTIVSVPFTVKFPGTVRLFPLNVVFSITTSPFVDEMVKLPLAPVCVIVWALVLSSVIFPAIVAIPLTSKVVVSVSPATVNCPFERVSKSLSASIPIFASSFIFNEPLSVTKPLAVSYTHLRAHET